MFREQLLSHSPEVLSEAALVALHRHYAELQRWNPRLSLVGPGTAGEVLARHYGESLAALPLLRPSDRHLVDLGTGAGFPGLVLAAARPALEVTLVEAQERKWAFLKAAVRRGDLCCQCLNVRVDCPLPAGFPAAIDVVVSRALALSPELLSALHEHSPQARFLLWQGGAAPLLPPSLAVCRELPLAASEHRRILEICGVS